MPPGLYESPDQLPESLTGRLRNPVRAIVVHSNDVAGSSDPVRALKPGKLTSVYTSEQLAVKGQRSRKSGIFILATISF